MDKAEASGKTVEDALNKALVILGAGRDEVELTVLDEGRKGGLFGRGAKDALVRVERLAAPARTSERQPPDTRIPHGPQRGPARGGGNQRPPGGESRDNRGARTRDGRNRDSRGRRPLDVPSPKLREEDFLPRGQADPGASPSPAATHGPAAAARDASARGQRPRRGTPGGDEREPGPATQSRERRSRGDEPFVEPDINAEEVDYAAHVVDDLLRILDINAELTIREPLTPGDGLGASRAVIDISGDGLGLLIGRRGDTLTAFQYIVNLIVNKNFPNRGGVTIDVEHYRHRREETVVSLARRMADRVRQTGAPITLEPMPPSERRLIHLALSEDPDLETNSVGEGENRKVVISARR